MMMMMMMMMRIDGGASRMTFVMSLIVLLRLLLLLQQLLMVPFMTGFLCARMLSGHPCQFLTLAAAQDRVEDFLGFRDARAFVIRLLRQPGVYRFVTRLGLSECPKRLPWIILQATTFELMLFLHSLCNTPVVNSLSPLFKLSVRRWLNRDLKMQQWFARIAKREKPMLFITEMLLEPGSIRV